MVMLYQDPTGKNVGAATPASLSVPRFSAHQSTNSNTDEKIMMLEKALVEKENKINELTHKIETETVGVHLLVGISGSLSLAINNMQIYSRVYVIDFRICT